MNVDLVDRIVQFAVLLAGKSDEFMERELGPIHLIKYVYLADLSYAARHDGTPYTGADWRFHHFGPWSGEVYQRLEPALQKIGARKRSFPSDYDKDVIRWSLIDDSSYAQVERTLPSEVASTLKRCVKKYANSTSELLHHVYLTEPMLNAAPGDPLVFRVAEPSQPSAPPKPDLTVKQAKRAQERRAAAKSQLETLLRARRERRESAMLVATPRYDEVFYQGVEWLDSLAGDALDEREGQLSIDPAIFKSQTRGDRRE